MSLIAFGFYRDANLFPLIATANGIADPNVIAVGKVLTIPDLPGHAPLQLFSHQLSLSWNGGEIEAETKSPFTVPAGKRLVLEDISIGASMGAKGQNFFVELNVIGLDRVVRGHAMPVFFQMNGEKGESDFYAGGRPIRIYVESGETLSAKAERNNSTLLAFVSIFVYGHFMDVSP